MPEEQQESFASSSGNVHTPTSGIGQPEGTVNIPLPGGGKVEAPFPKVAALLLAALVVAAVALFIYSKQVDPLLHKGETLVPNIQLKTYREEEKNLASDEQQLAQLRSVAAIRQHVQNEQYRIHYNERPTWKNSIRVAGAQLEISFFKSDGCFFVRRKSSDPKVPVSKDWIVDLSQYPIQKSPGAVNGGTQDSGSYYTGEKKQLGLPLLPTFPDDPLEVLAKPGARVGHSGPELVPAQYHPVAGRCINPHPGTFQTWVGQRNGCWIQIWRRFQDGCVHYEWFNSCYNYWDPKIYWTFCVH